MIRKSQSEDMASILALWMKSTIYATPLLKNATGMRAKRSCATSIYPPRKPGYGRKMNN
ncbi:acetyltransferase [Salmonella bongori]|nr:acetyltransferase [Salmonella bongori]